MDKAPDAFRTISEVAEDLDIPQHVLRFWETRFSSIRPLKRGGGRRYYRPDDVDLLKGIRQLLYGQGYTIKGVQRILKDGGPRAVQELGRGGTLVPLPPPRADDAHGDADDLLLDGADEGPAAREDVREAAGNGPSSPPDPRYATKPLAPRAGQHLRAALADLLECQRALDAVRRR